MPPPLVLGFSGKFPYTGNLNAPPLVFQTLAEGGGHLKLNMLIATEQSIISAGKYSGG